MSRRWTRAGPRSTPAASARAAAAWWRAARDGGQTWQQVTPLYEDIWWVTDVWVDPTNPSRVYFVEPKGVWRSLNGGDSVAALHGRAGGRALGRWAGNLRPAGDPEPAGRSQPPVPGHGGRAVRELQLRRDMAEDQRLLVGQPARGWAAGRGRRRVAEQPRRRVLPLPGLRRRPSPTATPYAHGHAPRRLLGGAGQRRLRDRRRLGHPVQPGVGRLRHHAGARRQPQHAHRHRPGRRQCGELLAHRAGRDLPDRPRLGHPHLLALQRQRRCRGGRGRRLAARPGLPPAHRG